MRRSPRFAITALLAACAAASAGSAQACGEVMYRMGGALRYQAFVTRHPADILLYNDSAVAQAPGTDRNGFREQLEKAGHKVTLVDGVAAFEQAVAARSFDIVITHAANVTTVESTLARTQREASLIPVIEGGNPSLRQQYPQALATNAGLNRFLKSIERTMEAQGG